MYTFCDKNYQLVVYQHMSYRNAVNNTQNCGKLGVQRG